MTFKPKQVTLSADEIFRLIEDGKRIRDEIAKRYSAMKRAAWEMVG